MLALAIGNVLGLMLLMGVVAQSIDPVDFSFRQCEPIRIDMCRGIGYNETSMPNLVGHELQTDVEFQLQTFTPLIEYVCSVQLKLFLCAAYVPLCTPKVPVPIGPCRSLCESVRKRCHPLLQGFGFPWPPALDCNRFPKENNHETMCIEGGPGEAHSPMLENDLYPGVPASKLPTEMTPLECPAPAKTQMYVKLYRYGRCAPLCNADILFGQHEKHLADVWVTTWTYAALGLAVISTLCLIFGDDTKSSSKWSRMLTPLIWCHDMVAIGWTVRFISGRTATSCGYDAQEPNISLLLIDGLSNASCATMFLLRYYFGMAACAWWAILCLGWHRDVRRNSPDTYGNMSMGAATSTYAVSSLSGGKRIRGGVSANKRDYSVTQNNWARFFAWGLPAFQTAAVIVARLVDADELLGACFVGNQSDIGLQILVATPLFCYWIFGSMNLISGYLVHRRNKEVMLNTNSPSLQHQLQTSKSVNSGSGTFLFIYCVPCSFLLLAIIYEFANIDVWLNVPTYITAAEGITTPLWPFLTRDFMELMLGIICSAWVLGPKISYKRHLTSRPKKQAPQTTMSSTPVVPPPRTQSSRTSNVAYSTVSYQTVRHQPMSSLPQHSSGTAISMKQISHYSVGRNKSKPHIVPTATHHHSYAKNHCNYKDIKQINRYGNETIL